MTGEHGSAVGGLIHEAPLPPWLCSLSLAGAAPISEVNLRVAWHFGGAPGRARALQACFGGVIAECPLLWLVVGGTAVGEQTGHVVVLIAGLG